MQMNGADRAREMEIFVAVAKSGSFSAAGRILGLTPSAVSRTVDRIEARLGVRLMLRTTRVLTLTAEGQTYLGAARRILADLDDAEQGIADQGAPRGRVRVSASLAHGRQHVVPLLGDFVRRYPHILIDINLTDVVVDVAAGQADVAIRFGPLADSPLTARRLGDTGRTIVASPDYLARRGTPTVPEDLHDLGDRDLVRDLDRHLVRRERQPPAGRGADLAGRVCDLGGRECDEGCGEGQERAGEGAGHGNLRAPSGAGLEVQTRAGARGSPYAATP